MNYKLGQRVLKTDLSATEKLVLLALVCHRSDESGLCNPSLKTLCDDCSLSERGVLNVLERLATRRLIVIEPGGGRGKPNSYVLFPDDEELNGVENLAPDQANGVGQKGSINPERRSGFSTQNRPENTERDSEFKALNTERGSGFRPETLNVVPFPSNERISSSSSSGNEPKNLAPILAAFDDLCEVDCDALSYANGCEVPKVIAWLLAQFDDPESAATAMRERFARWDKTNPPHPKQIRSDWKRMERLQRQSENPQPTQNPHGTHQPNSPDERRNPTRPSDNPTRQRVQSRQQLAAKLAEKYGNRGAD